MNKKSLVLVAVLMITTVSMKAQWFDFTNNVRASIGLNLGTVGYNYDFKTLDTQFDGFGAGACLSIGGVYLDFIYQGPEHRYSNQVAVDDWWDHTALTINAGYQIPVLPWFFVTPLVGYSNQTEGWTRANNIHAEDSSIVHSYDKMNMYQHFNYGAGVMFHPFSFLEIGAIATTHAIYGNISFSAGIK